MDIEIGSRKPKEELQTPFSLAFVLTAFVLTAFVLTAFVLTAFVLAAFVLTTFMLTMLVAYREDTGSTILNSSKSGLPRLSHDKNTYANP
ncbi:hypothetical protein AAH446_01965 [Erwinia sp. P6884]|uniref:hypothetical protein n=1 Tax=Erwinia sp. P6884 TaxID=3141450 RepID=UPI00318C2012